MPLPTSVASFILRFVQEAADATTGRPQADWHGVIKHVQTDEERHFTHLADAIAFIARYVELEEFQVGNSETQNDAIPNS